MSILGKLAVETSYKEPGKNQPNNFGWFVTGPKWFTS